MFASAIGKEDEGDMVVLEVGDGLRGAGDWGGGAEKYPINTKRYGWSTRSLGQDMRQGEAVLKHESEVRCFFFGYGFAGGKLASGRPIGCSSPSPSGFKARSKARSLMEVPLHLQDSSWTSSQHPLQYLASYNGGSRG